MNEPMSDREFVEHCRNLVNAGCSIQINKLPRLKNLAGSYSYDISMVEIASLRLDLAERDKQIAELSVSGGELIERWHTALDQRDEAREKLVAAERRIAKVRELVEGEGHEGGCKVNTCSTCKMIAYGADGCEEETLKCPRFVPGTCNCIRSLILSALSEEREK